MTTPASKGGSGEARDLERTRKQLKDMDRLLEEMLALPIGDRPRRTLDELDAPPERERPATTLATFARKAPPADEPERVVSFLAAPERTDAGAPWTPPDQQPHLDVEELHAGGPESQQVDILTMDRQEVADVPTLGDPLDPEPSPAHLTPRELRELVGLTEQQAKDLVTQHTPPSPLHWVLIGINAAYDRLADLLWPINGLLKWIGTRYLLGLVGIALLIGAALWYCIGRFGWTW